jgi:long-chain fatty acid transport protein
LHSLHFKRIGLALAGVLLTTGLGYGSGYSIFEQGARATAMGGAFAATADDPSAMFYNVAGIAFQRRMAAMTGGTWITFNASFEGDPASFPGEEARARFASHNFIIPTTYAVIPIGENMTFGLAQFAAFGLRTDWADGATFPGRFISQDAQLKSASIQPSFAWKTSNDRFAIGAGIEYRRARVILERFIPAINPFTQRIVDVAEVQLDTDWEADIGYNVGVIFVPADNWRIGISHRTDMEIDFEDGTAEFEQISTGNPQLDAIIRATALPPNQGITTSVPFPSLTHLGVATTLVPNWTIEFDAVRATWSEFDRLEVGFDQTPANNIGIDQNWNDTWSYRLGGTRPVTDRWNVSLGAVYDENPQDTEVVGPLLPDADRLGVSYGIGFRGEHWRVDASHLVIHFQERSTRGLNIDNFNGTYRTTANLVTVNLGYSF